MEATGPGGDYDTRWDLASARALAVLHYLNQRGIPSKRLKAVAYGSNRPKYADNRPEEKYLNNRVEIVIRDTDTE
jgi:chemotaxis protein MotB